MLGFNGTSTYIWSYHNKTYQNVLTKKVHKILNTNQKLIIVPDGVVLKSSPDRIYYEYEQDRETLANKMFITGKFIARYTEGSIILC